MKVAIGVDHGGFALKDTICMLLQRHGHEAVDVGCFSTESVDYPDYAAKVVEEIVSGRCSCGILICGTGIGMSIAANRSSEIRAALCHDEFTAKMSRKHNNANVLCLGARVLESSQAVLIVEEWLNADFEGGRHLRRVDKMSA